MIIKEYIKEFEKMGFGLFVHFGLYSVIGKGEWAKYSCDISTNDYESVAKQFVPELDWADNLAKTAKSTGCKYITLTTRHHDGFSLFDTCGLNDYDAPHTCRRDLVSEFVTACRAYDIVPFFYHTLLDWREKSYNTNFSAYLEYLRASVEILCKNYGKIGGLWFDGMWDKPEANWEEDALYSTIRKYQPEAMIINNTGMVGRGKLGHIELDSVTFERGEPQEINLDDSPKYIASEMCQVFGDHWGYTAKDLNYKSVASIIEDLCVCRRYGSNFLLNVGPMGNGSLRPLDKAMVETIGVWTKIYNEAIYLPRPTKIKIDNRPKDFILQEGNNYYLFVHDIPMVADPNVALESENEIILNFDFEKCINKIRWIDNDNDVIFEQNDGKVTTKISPFHYGESLVVRVAKITTNKE